MLGVSSEVGRLRSVLLHRPGDELKRLTPRNNDELLFDGIPWLERAQAEHDTFADALRARGVEVAYLVDLLVEALSVPAARAEVVATSVPAHAVGPAMHELLTDYLTGLEPAALAEVVTAGLSYEELQLRVDGRLPGLAARLARPREFVVAPLPNLLFTRDSSVWVGRRIAVASPSMPARAREASLLRAVYRTLPRFRDVPLLYGDDGLTAEASVEGGDVLLLAPGVVAIGVGERTTPAGAETLAGRMLADGLARVVLAVPIAQQRATMHLDTVVTMVDVDAVVMYPPAADELVAYAVTAGGVAGPRPFLDAAAEVMGVDRLRVIPTGLDPVTAEREQWDDGNNTLAIAPRLVVAYERNVETNARLEAAGIEVVRIAGSELGSGRGGPRCMSCPLARDEV